MIKTRITAPYLLRVITLKAYLNKLEDEKVRIRQKKELMISKFPDPITPHRSLEESLEHMDSLAYKKNEFFVKATKYRDQEVLISMKQVRIRLIRRSIVLLLVLLSCAFAQHLFPELGNSIKLSYFEIMAQLYPVLLIACYLNTTTVKDTEYNKFRYFVDAKFTGFILTAIGLVTCLYVIASGQTNTYSLLLSIVTMLFMLRVLLVEIMERR